MSTEQTLRECRDYISKALLPWTEPNHVRPALLAKIDAALAAPAPDLDGSHYLGHYASGDEVTVTENLAAPAPAAEYDSVGMFIWDQEDLAWCAATGSPRAVELYRKGAAVPQPVEPRYSEDEIADALMMAEVSDSKSESVMIFLREPDEPTFTPGGGLPGDHNGEKAAAPAVQPALERWGFKHQGAQSWVERMPDGYWTPWHLANEALLAASQEDTARLDWLDSEGCNRVFKLGSSWYTRQDYSSPHYRAENVRAAIDAIKDQA